MKPITTTKQSQIANWMQMINPLRWLSAHEAQMIYDTARRGNTSRLQWLYAEIEKADPTLMICKERRSSALVALDWTIRTKDGKRTRHFDQTLADEQAALLSQLFGEAEEAGLWDAVEHLSGAFFKGFAHVLPHWDADGLAISHLETLAPWNFTQDLQTKDWYWNPEAIDTIDFTALDRIPPTELITLQRDACIDYPMMQIYLRARIGEREWGKYIERYGIPPVIITMPPDIDPNRNDEYRAAAEQVAMGASGALPNGSSVSYASESRGVNPFTQFLDHQQQLAVLMATGGMLTSLTGATGIGQGASEAHQATWRTIVQRDAGIVAAAINQALTQRILDTAFPGKPHLASFDFETIEKPSADAIFDLATKAKTAGYRIDQADLEERTGYSLHLEQPTQMPGLSPYAMNKQTTPKPQTPKLQTLVASLQDDYKPLAQALQAIVDAPQAAQKVLAHDLLEQLPSILPDDPLLASALEAELAQAFTTDISTNKSTKQCKECGKWTDTNGVCQHCIDSDTTETKGGNPDPEQVQQAQMGKAKEAISNCLETHQDIHDACSRGDIGMISFVYGQPGDPDNAYKGGYGLAHIAAKHGDDGILQKLHQVIIQGDKEEPKGGNQIKINYGGYKAILAKSNDSGIQKGHEKWILTAFKKD